MFSSSSSALFWFLQLGISFSGFCFIVFMMVKSIFPPANLSFSELLLFMSCSQFVFLIISSRKYTITMKHFKNRLMSLVSSMESLTPLTGIWIPLSNSLKKKMLLWVKRILTLPSNLILLGFKKKYDLFVISINLLIVFQRAKIEMKWFILEKNQERKKIIFEQNICKVSLLLRNKEIHYGQTCTIEKKINQTK